MTSGKLFEKMNSCIPESEHEYRSRLNSWLDLAVQVELDDYAREEIYETLLKDFVSEPAQIWQVRLIHVFLFDWNKHAIANTAKMLKRWEQIDTIIKQAIKND